MTTPNILHPGIYFDETPRSYVVPTVSTSIAGFVGICQKGPINVATVVTSWNDFVSKFGTFIPGSPLAYAVFGFFNNGGSICYIVRAVHNNVSTGLTSASATLNIGTGALVLKASSDGTWGNNISAEIQSASWGTGYYKLVVRYLGTIMEVIDNLSNTSTSNQYAGSLINNSSQYVSVTALTSTDPTVVSGASLTGGSDGLAGITDADYVGSASTAPNNTPSGLYCFNSVVGGINLVAIPGVTTSVTQLGIQSYVENVVPQTILAVLDPPLASSVYSISTWRQTTCSFNSFNTELFYPNIIVPDPIGVGVSPLITIPPSGHIMGTKARIDGKRGVWKASAGLEAVLLGVSDTEYHVSDTDQDSLNPLGINCIRTPLPGSGIVIWGGRTLTTSDPRYTYTSVRRLIQFIEVSLKAQNGWAVFEPNDDALYAKLYASCVSLVNGIWVANGLKGSKATDAYMVVCDKSNNVDDTSGKVYADIGVAALKPGEFIIFRVGLK